MRDHSELGIVGMEMGKVEGYGGIYLWAVVGEARLICGALDLLLHAWGSSWS